MRRNIWKVTGMNVVLGWVVAAIAFSEVLK